MTNRDRLRRRRFGLPGAAAPVSDLARSARVTRLVAVGFVLLLTGPVVAMAAAPPAHAATYRYWSYWSVSAQPGASTQWRYASSGPASHVPSDGSVEGWRFGVSVDSSVRSRAPRVPSSTAFMDLCGATKPVAGSKRVAIVIDYGATSEAPIGQTPPTPRGGCVVAPLTSTGAAVMSRAPVSAGVRVKDGLICAIDGYPRGECAPVVAGTDPQPVPRPSAAAGAGATPATSRSASPPQSNPGKQSLPAPRSATGSPVPTSSGSVTPTAAQSRATPTAAAPNGSETPVALSTAPASGSGGANSATGAIIGVLAVIGLGGLAWFLTRRGRP